ncbi:MAG TPA: hypothetical protein VHD81_03700 [Mycobacteriales bacterium]|nr:hypothetical protein [Mycobacteriales bacterium]
MRSTATGERRLKMSADGADLVCSLQDEQGANRSSGLRIVIDPQHRSLSMSITDRRPEDVVVTRDGARVYLSVAADKRLRGCTLRAGAAGSESGFYLDRSVSARSVVSK